LRIVLVRRECGMHYGGAEAYCLNIARILTSRGHKVTVVAREVASPGVRHLAVPVRGRGSILKNLSFYLGVKRLLARESYDLSYGLSRVAPVDVLRVSDPLHAAWLDLDRRQGSSVRKLSPRNRLLLWLEATSIQKARAIVANSQLVERQLQYYYGRFADKVTVVHNGVDLDRFRPMSASQRSDEREKFGLPRNALVFIFAGSNLRRKGFAVLLSTLAAFHHEPFFLLAAGSSGSAALEEKINRMALRERIRWLGYVAALEKIYGLADLFILPTLYDPFANTVLEALACGIPALTTRQNGAAEAAGQVAPWLVVAEPDPRLLLAAISRFASLAQEEKMALGRKAREIARTYTWARHTEKLTRVFQQLLASGRRQEGDFSGT